MTNYLLTLRYDGRNFCGYQIQLTADGEKRTVGGELKKAILSVFGAVEKLSGCSRTDSGVHSTGYCVSFSSEKKLPEDVVVRALNAKLPRDISVMTCRYVSDDFHARYSVVSKKYEYRIYSSPVRDPFKEGLWLHYPYKIDEDLLKNAAKGFIGEHDFRSFMASGSKITDTVRTVYDTDFYSVGENEFIYSVSADGFLYNMVRIMVGTLLDIQSGKIAADSVPSIINCKDRSFAGHTAPPDGLYLCEVRYNKF
jgi:tRNA pseudouridine38-40 synthase